MTDVAAPPKTAIDRFLAIVERAGNTLPHPATLFFLLTVFVVVASAIAAQFDLSVLHPKTGEPVTPVNLLSVEGLQRIMANLVTNFTSFAPLGTVLVALIGIGVAEHSGLIGACLRIVVLNAPRFLLTPIVVFAGVMSNMASEIGYVLLVPLAGLLYVAAGRHPILGIAAAFAGVSGGYSANLLLGTIDPLLSGLSQEAARIVDSEYTVSPAANLFFMQASTPSLRCLAGSLPRRSLPAASPMATTAAATKRSSHSRRRRSAACSTPASPPCCSPRCCCWPRCRPTACCASPASRTC